MKALMLALMTWASPITGLPVTEPPSIVYMEACEMERMHLQEHADCSDDFGPLGVYSPGVIFLQEGWSPDNLRDLSILLHELVHHMDFHATGITGVTCVAWPKNNEAIAYDAQFKWLESAGVTEDEAMELLSVNALAVFMATTCQ